MASYTVIQDIEAEDKFVGPLTLKQFIFAGIAVVLLYVSFLLIVKGAWPFTTVLVPPALVALFLAWPWGRDQPTEVWLLGKIRFILKPRLRIWNQMGLKELVTITVPKKIEVQLTDGLSQDQVKSRLSALAQTIDTRGWAVKGVDANLNASDDRLAGLSALPLNPAMSPDMNGADDMLDANTNQLAQHMSQLVSQSSLSHRNSLLTQMDQARQRNTTVANVQPLDNAPDYFQAQFTAPASPPASYMQPATPVSLPAPTPSQTAFSPAPTPPPIPITAAPKPAILDLARNDDLSVATIARQASKAEHLGDEEVVISLR